MNRTKLLAIVLGVVLVISLGVNVYFGIQNASLEGKAKELEMISVLTQVQSQVSAELKKIGTSLVYAAGQLSTVGLEGDQATSILTALAANSSFIADALTADANNNVVSVVPSSYSNLTGIYLGNTDNYNTNYQANVELEMTDRIPLVEGFSGIVIYAPVFNSNKEFMGGVSITFDPTTLLNASVSSAIAGTPYAMWAIQTNGLVLFDSAHPDEVGLMLFEDPTLSQYPQTLTVMHQIVNDPSGHTIYQYPATLGSEQVVDKEAEWKTIGTYGVEWRLVIVQAINP